MKFYLQLVLLLSSTLFVFSCKKRATESKIELTELSKDSVIKKKETSKHFEYKYVIAPSGLNYRDFPNGNILGKFSWREKVEYLFDTEQTQKIIDNYEEVKGTWVAVKHEKDTVFIFSHYVSNSEPSFSNIKLYYADAYSKLKLKPSNKLDIRQAFVNVSESFNMPENFIHEKDLLKDTIHFNKKQRIEFLKRMNYSEKDTIFIYNIASGLVKKHLVKKTPLIACISLYSQIEEEYKEENYNQWDYQIGFNLGKSNHDGFAIIGKENPFIEKGLKPLVFKEMSLEMINNNIKNKLISKSWINDTVYKKYTSKYENIRSFVKMKNGYNNWSDLIFKNFDTKDSYHIYQSEGESSSKAPLEIKEEKPQYNESHQYIGRLFKNKPPVTFGFIWESFGCPQIHFLDKDELPILILCDNRH
ncbi:hypothetical protein [Tenacibaculum sp. Ill]|uniref:hypothetical protein n=1 Tax=Tenacibaculum sp. Ill TaxID=3445935 RepID=UPI003F7B15F9